MKGLKRQFAYFFPFTFYTEQILLLENSLAQADEDERTRWHSPRYKIIRRINHILDGHLKRFLLRLFRK